MSARRAGTIAAALTLLVVTWIVIHLRQGAASAEAPPRYRTTTIERGEVTAVVEANGTVQPRVLVQVGTQVTGVVEQMLKDFNDPVRAGETIAVLDSRRLVAQVRQAEAALGQARADLVRTQALAHQAERDLARTEQLAQRQLVSASEVDASLAAAHSSRAQVDVAAAVVSSSLARLESERTNLDYATIVSPVDGVVVARNVDVGQTVAASLQAPTLFEIAGDLKVVQVQASVPEADIGRLRRSMRATFSVDAHQGRTFEGAVSQIRLAATTVDNVVTYTVLVDAANPDELLMPGMTANVAFEVDRAEDAWLVPIAALRFRPATLQEDAAVQDSTDRVFVQGDDGILVPVEVKVGVSNGVRVAVTPVAPASFDASTRIVLGVATAEEEPQETSSIFGPPRLGGPRRKT